MMTTFSRQAWDASPPSRRQALDWALVRHIVIHYPGHPPAIGTDTGRIAALLRSWQRLHMQTKGWADIAYGVAVDQAGRTWALRGIDTRDGATSGHGGTSQSILAILGNAETPSAAMLSTLARLAHQLAGRAPAGVRIVGHRALVSTSCPGDQLARWIKAGLPTNPNPSPEEDPMPTAREVADELLDTPIIRAGAAEGVPGAGERITIRTMLEWSDALSYFARRDIAALSAELDAITSAISTPTGIDLDAVRAAARAGVADAIASIETTVTVHPQQGAAR